MATATARQRLEDFVTSFENPEITAMAALCRILEDLPDEAARLRVMRWAFGKYSDEFKRPAPAPAPPPATPLVPIRPVLVTAMPVDLPEEDAPETQPADFDRQVAELNDLFSDRPDGIKLAKPRPR